MSEKRVAHDPGAAPPNPTVIPVSVLIERRVVSRGGWSIPHWDALGVVAGEDVARSEPERTLVSRDGDRERYLWSGLTLALHKDGCESYWHNLLNERPYLFVVCFDDETDSQGGEPTPVLVTANQDEANAHMESDDPVFSVPMPDPVRDQVERFVVAHYVPEEKKKRKRRNWAEESLYGRGPPPKVDRSV